MKVCCTKVNSLKEDVVTFQWPCEVDVVCFVMSRFKQQYPGRLEHSPV